MITPRILLYSHDSFGLGHLRRSLTLAGALRDRLPGAGVLVVTGSACATQFHTPRGVEVVKLPGITKDRAGRYVARDLPMPLRELVRLRSRLLLELWRNFRPDLLLVDHKVRGLEGELDPVLQRAREGGTRTMLGLRDIIDEPAAVLAEWGGPEERRALREFYDRVLVYGAPEVLDPRTEYSIPELGEQLVFTGYVVRPRQESALQVLPRLRRNVLVTVGGGEDGFERIRTYLSGLENAEVDWESTIVLGPLIDPTHARRIRHLARSLPHTRVHLFYEDLPRLLREASAVVAMAGYNTVAEIIQSGTPAVLLPRSQPRAEQLIRARRMERLGLVTCLDPATPESLIEAVRSAVSVRAERSYELPLDGATRVADLAAELLGEGVEARKVASG